MVIAEGLVDGLLASLMSGMAASRVVVRGAQTGGAGVGDVVRRMRRIMAEHGAGGAGTVSWKGMERVTSVS
jgi:hypothetical protein